MGISSYKEAERYRVRQNKNLTRSFYLDTKRTLDEEPFTQEQIQNTNQLNNVERVNYSEGSKLTGTDKTLEQNIKDDHKAFNNYRKSIGQPTIPLDNEYIKMWIRTRLKDGGKVEERKSKAIPMDLESVAFRLFQDKLDNLSYNQKQTVYDYIEDTRNKKADGGVSKEQSLIEEILSGKIKIGADFTNKNKNDPFNKYGFGKRDIKDPRLGIEYIMDPGDERSSKIGISVGPKGGSINFMKPFSEKLNEEKNEDVIQTYIDFARNVWGVEVTEQEARKALGIYDMPDTSIRNELPPEEIEKKATGGRVKFQNGSDDGYMQEIPSLGFSDPIDILEQQLVNEKDPIKILILEEQVKQLKKEREEKQIEREEYKKAQKEKGVKYKEDFPSEAEYFLETGKQILTNPKYTLGKLAKGAIEGTEFLVGQPLQTLFSQEGKNFELYEPVAGEKLGLNKFIEEAQPKDPTTGTMIAGDVFEIAGSVADPFLAYGVGKAALRGAKKKPSKPPVDETIDPARRDILKTGAVIGGGALLYPTAKKLGMFDELAKGAKAVRVLPKVKGMPEWFSPLVSKIEREGLDITSEISKLNKSIYAGAASKEVAQAKKLKISVPGKKEPDIITLTEYKNGDFLIEADTYGGAFDSPFDLYYTAPKEVTETQFIRGKDGKLYEKKVIVKKEGDFTVLEDRPQYASPQFYYDDALELERLEFTADDAISDLERLEKIATGKKPKPEQIKKRKENKEYVEKNPREDADSRLPEPSDYYDQ